MNAPVTVDVQLLAKALRISSREGIQALRAGLKDAEANLWGICYENRADPFIEWCYQMGQRMGEQMRKQPGFVVNCSLVRPSPQGGWIVSRAKRREPHENP